MSPLNPFGGIEPIAKLVCPLACGWQYIPASLTFPCSGYMGDAVAKIVQYNHEAGQQLVRHVADEHPAPKVDPEPAADLQPARSPMFAVGDRVLWGEPGARCDCDGHGHKHKPDEVTVVSVPVPRPGGKITYAVATEDGIAVADAAFLFGERPAR